MSNKKKQRNYFQEMKSGLYDVITNKMALYTASTADQYIKPRLLANTGKMVTVEENYGILSINILAMIDITNRGYPIELVDKTMVREIVDIISGHLETCAEVQRNDAFDRLPVPKEDLVLMEEFMLEVLEKNVDILSNEYIKMAKSRLSRSGMLSRYSKPRKEQEVVETVDIDRLRKFTKSDVSDLDFESLLNDF